MLPYYYLVTMNDDEEELMEEFENWFAERDTHEFSPNIYAYAGHVKASEKGCDEEEDYGKDIYTVSDDANDYPEAQVITLEQWKQMIDGDNYNIY